MYLDKYLYPDSFNNYSYEPYKFTNSYNDEYQRMKIKFKKLIDKLDRTTNKRMQELESVVDDEDLFNALRERGEYK